MRASVLDEIGSAAKAGDTKMVVAATERLRHVESLLERQQALTREAQQLIEGSHESAAERPGETMQARPQLGESPRGTGDRRRVEFAHRLSQLGKRLIQVRGALYRNQAGDVVGIAYASERVKDGWFLGLPEGAFQHAVLLCEPTGARVLAVCLPRTFFDRYEKHLSRSQGQLKFNVKRRGGRYHIPVPVVGAVDVTEYIDNFGMIG
jgi:hypothetical protein